MDLTRASKTDFQFLKVGVMKVVTDITLDQVPKTKSWIHEIEKEFGVSVTITDSGNITIQGPTRTSCHDARASLIRRVRLEDFHNAMEILRLSRSSPHCEQFSAPTSLLGCLESGNNAEILKNYENAMNCVLKIDRTGNISIFGEKNACVALRQFIMKLVENEDEAQKNAQKGSADEAGRTSATTVDTGNPTLAAGDVGGAIDAVLRGECIDNTEDELDDNSSIRNNTAKTPVCETGPVQAKKSFAQPNAGFGSGNGNGVSIGAPLLFKDKLAIDSSQIGRVIGRQHINRIRIQNQFRCRFRIEELDLGAMVLLEGHTADEVKAAKEDIVTMLKKPGPWEQKSNMAERQQ